MPKGPDFLKDILLPNLKGVYGGTMVNSLEYPALKNLIALADLRDLYSKVLPQDVELLEMKEGFNFDSLRAECEDHYHNIFEYDKQIMNTDLILEKFPKYYNFIEQFVASVITIERFKEMYYEIINLMRHNIKMLIRARKQVIYEVENKIQSRPDNIQSSQTVPEKMIWNRTVDDLQNLFNNLAEKYYFEKIAREDLYMHFYFPNEEDLKPNQSKIFKKIDWLKTVTSLSFLIKELEKINALEFSSAKVNDTIEQHFSRKKKIIKNYGQSKFNATQVKNSLLYITLTEIINSSFK